MTMDTATLVVSFISAIAAAASAVFALVQARAAKLSRHDAASARDEARKARNESAQLAGEANAAFVRQAEAQEEANRLKQLEQHDWMFTLVGEGTWRAVNTSRRVLVDVAAHVTPDNAKSTVKVASLHPDGRYEPGDSLTFQVTPVYGVWLEKLLVVYRYADAVDAEQRVFWFVVP